MPRKIVIVLFLLTGKAFAQYDLPCNAGPRSPMAFSLVSSNSIIITWPTNDLRTELRVARRVYTNNPNYWQAWTWLYTNNNLATVKQASQYSDTNVFGTHFEYCVATLSTNWNCVDGSPFGNGVAYASGAGLTNNPTWAYQYINTGYQVPLKDNRGNLILLVDSGVAAALGAELTTLTNDLIGDGYKVFRHDVAASEVVTNGGANTIWFNAVTNTKAAIVADYNTDPSSDWTIFIVGHVPVPYSGLTSPGSHLDNFGAHPADWYYADTNSANWTDATANDTSASYPSDWNVPGDGRFDQNKVPGVPHMRVGRLDLTNMVAFTNQTYAQLMQQYLNRDHAWRTRQTIVRDRGLIITNGSPFEAYSVWASFFGSISNADMGQWLIAGTNPANTYLFAAERASGGFDHDNILGTTTNIAASPIYAVFTAMYGSYYGDWDSGQHSNDFAQSILANSGYALTMQYDENTINIGTAAMGEPIGQDLYSLAANNYLTFSKRYVQSGSVSGGSEFATTEYVNNYVSLLGDPTLKARVVIPPTNVLVHVDAPDRLITWGASSDTNIQGYHVYKMPGTNLNNVTRLTASVVAGPYRDTNISSGTWRYMVRAVKLEDSANRSYFNASIGIFDDGTLHTNYYVATNGLDSNPGSSSQPFLTIQKSLNVSAAGDVIKVQSGNYPENLQTQRSGTPSFPIVLDGQGVASTTSLLNQYSNFWLINFTLTNTPSTLTYIYLYPNSDSCLWSNNIFEAGTNQKYCFLWYGADAVPFGKAASYNLVISNRMHGTAGQPYVSIQGNENRVIGNFLYDGQTPDLFRVFGTSNYILSNICSNMVYNTNISNHPDFLQVFGNGAAYGSRYHVVASNTVIDCGVQLGNFTDDGNTNVHDITFINNLFNNVMHGSSCAMPGLKWYNNTFVNCGWDATSGNIVLSFVDVGATGRGDRGEVFNNIFWNCGNPASTPYSWYSFDTTLTNVAADYNFVATNGVAVITDPQHRAKGSPGGWDKFQWWEDHGINGGNPLFVNASSGNYHLLTNSPLIGSATNLNSLFLNDMDGVIRGSSWDIGAYEATGQGTNATHANAITGGSVLRNAVLQ